MFDAQVLAFAGVALILTITPGADTMLVVRSVFARGQQAGLLTTAGICTGLFVHAILSGMGLSLVLVQSAELFNMVKLAGACYLIYLGAYSLWKAWNSSANSEVYSLTVYGIRTYKSARRSFLEGMLNNVLNPKVAVFYLAFLPQFISPGEPVLMKSILLAGIHFVLGLVWLSAVTLFLGRMKAVISSSQVQRVLEAVGGVIIVALGLRLAVERR